MRKFRGIKMVLSTTVFVAAFAINAYQDNYRNGERRNEKIKNN